MHSPFLSKQNYSIVGPIRPSINAAIDHIFNITSVYYVRMALNYCAITSLFGDGDLESIYYKIDFLEPVIYKCLHSICMLKPVAVQMFVDFKFRKINLIMYCL